MTKVLYTAVGSADKFVSDYVIRHSNASSGRVKKVGFGPTLGSPLNGITKQQNPLGTKERKGSTMKPLIKFKTTSLLVIPLVLACFALLPRAQAVSPELLPAPAPDGAYTGFNTAEGLNALHNVNTAVGQFN